MAPVRRYLRLSKYTVLECRIYLDNPALAQSWLLNPRSPILPRVIESVRPLVLPKLREERERGKKKGNKKKGIKDVIITDEFEVSVFLTETNTRHSLLFKTKHFRENLSSKMGSNSNKLISQTDTNTVDVDALDQSQILQEDDEESLGLHDIPLAGVRRSKRARPITGSEYNDADLGGEEDSQAIEIDSDAEAPSHKRHRGPRPDIDEPDENDDKKKLAVDVSYDGFAIYGQVLCLVVKRKDAGKPASRAGLAADGTSGNQPGGQAKMENWISSTQVPIGEDIP